MLKKMKLGPKDSGRYLEVVVNSGLTVHEVRHRDEFRLFSVQMNQAKFSI